MMWQALVKQLNFRNKLDVWRGRVYSAVYRALTKKGVQDGD